MDSREILKKLTTSEPSSLLGLPDTFGIYALWDHERNIRYIGCTPKATEGFRSRIGNKHVTGSEGRSHKFSQAYCTGRMWRYCKTFDPLSALSEQNSDDAKLAKKLRSEFIRKYCRVTYVEIPKVDDLVSYFSRLTALEAQVQKLAPAGMRSWEGISFKPVPEPIELVNSLLTEIPSLREAAERQASVFKKHIVGPRTNA